jgi:hypothetical protein
MYMSTTNKNFPKTLSDETEIHKKWTDGSDLRSKSTSAAGLPDFFRCTTYQNGKNIPNDHNIDWP